MLTDDSLMPFGAYKGKKMEDVPAEYLLYIFDNKKCTAEVKQYIIENEDVLEMEIEKSKLPTHAKAMGWALNLNKREQ